jgi:hypothetical protein
MKEPKMNANRIGIWIPVWIENLKLSHSQTKLLAEIVSLHEKGGCYASNKYLSEVLDLKADTISRLITDLKRKGHLTQTGFDGRRRFLTPNYRSQSEQKDLEKMPTLSSSEAQNFQGRGIQKSKADSEVCAAPISTLKVQQNVHSINSIFQKENKSEMKSKTWEGFLSWSRGRVTPSTWFVIQACKDPKSLKGTASVFWEKWNAV